MAALAVLVEFPRMAGRFAILVGGLLMAGSLAWMGVKGLRGVSDSSGETTSKPVAIVCLVLAGLLSVGAVAVAFWLELP